MPQRLIKIRQQFDCERLDDVDAALQTELRRLESVVAPGSEIAVAVGSRGVANIVRIVCQTVAFIKERGASAFIVPAMGSHGGATAAGQEEILASYGITEASVGAPIRSSMEVVELPKDRSAVDVFMDRHAWESDGVIVINRVKPHTDFHGPYESGLVKICVIGLGKHRQALAVHRHGVYGLRELIPLVARDVLATGKVLGGIGVVENAYDQTMIVRALRGDEFFAVEPELLAAATANMPKLPVEKIDVLIVDQIGKDISGAGLDPNIIGRILIRGEAEPESPDIKSIFACDLTEASHGNAVGMGLIDVITRRLREKIDLPATYENVYTSSFLERAKIPIVVDSSYQAMDYALRGSGPPGDDGPRIVRIRDTLHLGEVQVSQAILNELGGRDDIEVIGEPVDLFDDDGELTAF